mmetsp:Transcript_782/g.1755  ORF Transcript_782/g.1755 Transcript_782/m.1755 type:complete len:600 (+) Transcript_782:67-1866(+)|eukprot:CAMPEP_0181442838 /NCGR_PEP_ID=MMETSP1110-20121109/24237_1 /TAXON_ID=174948 /ORGANISM="Symbiodinium sp., Strain CCMP421" /LENGTH=599 /DNA_ID=CAMNT_0023566781 /DNA_START=44 /DNA_END=1843 /DNA_ORIENTATION=-
MGEWNEHDHCHARKGTVQSLHHFIKRASRTKPIPEEDEGAGLHKCLRTKDVVGFGLGVTVGAGVFMATGKAAQEAGPAVSIAFLIAAFGCSCTGLCYAEMANLAPSTGSSYSFVYHTAGELPACMVGIINIVNNVLSGSAVARGWEGYLRLLLVSCGLEPPAFMNGFEFGPFEISFLAPLLLAFVIMINLFGTLAVSTFNNIVTMGSLVMLITYVIGGAFHVQPENWDPYLPTGISGVAQAAGSVFFSYIGFDVLATLGTETTSPRVIPCGIVLTLLITTVLYCSVGMVFTGLIKYTDISSKAPLASAAESRDLHILAVMVAVGAVGNTLTTVIGCVLAQPRLCFAMAQDGLLPATLVRVNRFGAPARSLLVMSFPALFFAACFDFHAIADVVSTGALSTFSLVCASLILMRCPRPMNSAGGVGVNSHSGTNEEEESRPPRLPAKSTPKPVLIGLVTFAASVFVLGLLCRIPASGPVEYVIYALIAVAALAALGAAGVIFMPFWRSREDTYTFADQTKRAHGFRMPLMPLPPLLGILMNVLLISQMSILTLIEALLLQVAAAVFYLFYSAPRSHLNRATKTWNPAGFQSTVPPADPDTL